jgi:hypothetical protein
MYVLDKCTYSPLSNYLTAPSKYVRQHRSAAADADPPLGLSADRPCKKPLHLCPLRCDHGEVVKSVTQVLPRGADGAYSRKLQNEVMVCG